MAAAATADARHPRNVIPATNVPCLVLFKLTVLALPIAQISIGAKYRNECTQQNSIPVYLVVSGVSSIILNLLTCLPCSKESSGLKLICSIWNGLLSTFAFCWFITGSVWIYSIYPPNFNSTVTGVAYCNKTLYQFAFWTTTITYIVLALVLVIGCCCCMCLCVSKPIAETRVPVEV